MTDIQKRLYAMQDKEYRSFQSRLMPTVNPDKIIGVRVPKIRELARDVIKNEPGIAADFLVELPHHYYEEDNLHVFLVNRTKDFDACLMQVEAFLPHLDNWATCDSFRPEVFRQHRQQVLAKARGWMKSGHCYTVRFGIGCMMSYFLDEDFSPEQLELVGGISSEEYYVRMMQAWYLPLPWPNSTSPHSPILARIILRSGPTTRPSRRRWKAIGLPPSKKHCYGR